MFPLRFNSVGLLLVIAALACSGFIGEGAKPAAGKADDFFGITNLYSFHVIVQPDQWAIMETYDRSKSGAFPLPPGNATQPMRPDQPPPGLNGERPTRPPGGGPMMGIEFRK